MLDFSVKDVLYLQHFVINLGDKGYKYLIFVILNVTVRIIINNLSNVNNP